MFSTKSQLQRRTPDNGTDREQFLSLLVDEYLNSTSYDAKSQVLANLANFAYDPINYGYIRDVGVLDVFLHVINTENDEKLLHFACSGICNLSCDPLNVKYIQENCGWKPIIQLLNRNNTDIVANIITTLIYAYEKPEGKILDAESLLKIKDFEKSEGKKVANLAAIFLQDVSGLN